VESSALPPSFCLVELLVHVLPISCNTSLIGVVIVAFVGMSSISFPFPFSLAVGEALGYFFFSVMLLSFC